MNFDSILKNLLENAIASFNTGDYSSLDDFLMPLASISVPEIKNEKVETAAQHIVGRENVYEFWKQINEQFGIAITKTEFLEIGKTSTIRCTYAEVGLIMDLQIHFNEYGKATKLVHLLCNE